MRTLPSSSSSGSQFDTSPTCRYLASDDGQERDVIGAFTYPRSEPGSGGHLDLVERLHTFASDLRREVESLPESEHSHRPGEDEWSIKEVCGHLCDHARFLHERLFRMIKQEEPLLPAWDQIAEWKKRDPQSVPLAQLLDEFTAQRVETVDMLADLVHWNWARQGRHEERGRLSIRQLVDFAIEHDEAHLDQVRAIKSAAT